MSAAVGRVEQKPLDLKAKKHSESLRSEREEASGYGGTGRVEAAGSVIYI
jgi:hypothetical protein